MNVSFDRATGLYIALGLISHAWIRRAQALAHVINGFAWAISTAILLVLILFS